MHSLSFRLGYRHPSVAKIASLGIADAPGLWAELGFELDGQDCWVSGVRHRLGLSGSGIVGWSITDAPGLVEFPLIPSVDGEPRPTPEHPNGVVALDHVVVSSGDIDGTIERFEGCGIDLRRTRRFEADGQPMMQAFFKLEEVAVEVVGPPGRVGDDPSGFFGLAFTVNDLDTTVAHLGELLRTPKEAVQPGRRIATLDRAAGSTVAMAFMSPRPGR